MMASRSSLAVLQLAGMQAALALGLFIALSTYVCAAEPAEPEVTAYDAELDSAKKLVLDKHAVLLRDLAKRDELEEAVKLREEMKVFEKSGILIGRAELRDVFKVYGRTTSKAAVDLRNSYLKRAKELTVAGKLDAADKLHEKAATIWQPGKLVSLLHAKGRSNYIQHGNYRGWLRPAESDSSQLNSTFELLPGLADDKAVSFRSANVPDHYLAHGDLRLWLIGNDNSDVFRQNATFRRVKGLSNARGASFEALNFPGHYIRAKGEELIVGKNDGTNEFKVESTFVIVAPLFDLW